MEISLFQLFSSNMFISLSNHYSHLLTTTAFNKFSVLSLSNFIRFYVMKASTKLKTVIEHIRQVKWE